MSRHGDKDEITLSRTALRIYIYLAEKGRPLGPREIARDLGLAPSLVYYHLKKLEELGLVVRHGTSYVVVKPQPIEGFIVLGRRYVHRLTLYGLLFLGILCGEIIVISITTFLTWERILLMVVTLLATILLFIEGIRLRKRLALK